MAETDRRPVVVRSVNCADGIRCIDIIEQQPGEFRFREFRRAPEDPRGWRPSGALSDRCFASAAEAETGAAAEVGWFAALVRHSDA